MNIFRFINKKLYYGIKTILRFISLKIVYPLYYDIHKAKAIDENKVIFLETRLEGVSNSYEVIYDRLVNDYNFDVRVHHLRETTALLAERTGLAFSYLKDLATAKYVFLNDASRLNSCVKMRPETVVMQLWHGCGAFKKFGFSTAELIFGETLGKMKKYPFYKNMDYVTVSSPEVEWAYKEAMNIKDSDKCKVLPLGISRSDIYYDQTYKDKAFAHLYSIMPEAKGKKIILYSPTFRGRVAYAKAPRALNIGLFNYILSDEYVMLIKHHPFVKNPPKIEPHYAHFVRDVSLEMSIEELLTVSDICISDYSSLVFEYSLLERPLLFYAFDLEDYCDWRGFYYPYDQMICGPVIRTNEELIDQIKNIDKYDLDEVRRFRDKFMGSCDGHVTERILENFFGKEALSAHKK